MLPIVWTVLFLAARVAAQTLMDVRGHQFTFTALPPGEDPTSVLVDATIDLYSDRSGHKAHTDLYDQTCAVLSNEVLDIGRNWLVATVTEWRPALGSNVVTVFSNEVDRAGYRIAAPTGTNVTWVGLSGLRSAATTNSGPNPVYRSLASTEFFHLQINPTNGITFYQDTLPVYEPPDTNPVQADIMNLPMPPKP